MSREHAAANPLNVLCPVSKHGSLRSSAEAAHHGPSIIKNREVDARDFIQRCEGRAAMTPHAASRAMDQLSKIAADAQT